MGFIEVAVICLGAGATKMLYKYILSEDENDSLPLNLLKDNNEKKEIGKKIDDLLIKYKDYFDFLMPYPLTQEQRVAVVDDSPRSLIVASAGSGKTSVLEAKYGYLIESSQAMPNEILVLAFNANVKKEVKKRISENPNIRANEPRVETFHSYGRSLLLKEGTSVIIDPDAKEDVDRLIPSKLIKNLIQKAEKNNPNIRKQIQDFRLLCPYLSIIQIVKNHDEYKQLIKEYPYKKEYGKVGENERELMVPAIDGKTFVKSQEELLIVNHLIVNGIKFEYEKKFASSDHPYQPDFYFPEINMWYEHFAIRADGTSPFEGYVQQADHKKILLQKNNANTLYTYSYQYQDNTILNILDKRLADEGIKKKRLLEKDIDRMINKVYKKDDFFNLLRSAIGLYKSSQLTKSQIENKYNQAEDRFRSNRFKEILLPIQKIYEDHLKANDTIDYEDMIKKATQLVKKGNQKGQYKFILVDEFQDVSISRTNLLHAILSQNNGSKLFAVGDDWQSIYRFTGSDLSAMSNFKEKFYQEGPDQSTIYCIQKTHRFPQTIADLSSFFIQKNPEQIPKKIVSHASIETSDIHFCEMIDYSNKTILQLLEDIPIKTEKQSVYILGRSNFDTEHINISDLSKKRPDLEFEKSTIHKVKGLEKNITIILGLDSGKFPYLWGDDPLLEVFLPPVDNYQYSEERRVMYVAMTRSFEHVYIASKFSKQESSFKSECRVICEEYKIPYSNHIYGGEVIKPCPKCEANNIPGGMVIKTANVLKGKNPNVFMSCNMFSHLKYKCNESDFDRAFCPVCYPNGRLGKLSWIEGRNKKLKIKCDVCEFSDNYCNYHTHYKTEDFCKF